jgi:hypothetical protein
MDDKALSDVIDLSPSVTAAVQLRTLRYLIRSVQENARDGLRPVIAIDLDLTALMPIYRTRQALLRTGAALGINAFLTPDSLPLLPAYSDEAWLSFVRRMNLKDPYHDLRWFGADGSLYKEADGPFAVFHEEYWNADRLSEDSPTPGLGSFVYRVQEAGGSVVFVSGRWLKAHVAPSLQTLRRAGIPAPNLLIGNDWHPTLVHPPERALSDAEIKVRHCHEITRQYGLPIAIIDDRPVNRAAVANSTDGELLEIAICIPGFTNDPVNEETALRISTFELFDHVLEDQPKRSYMIARYRKLGVGNPWRGLYEGIGANDLPYIIPRMRDNHLPFPEAVSSLPFAKLVAEHRPGSLTEEELVELSSSTIPPTEIQRMNECLLAARRLADQDQAAPFPPAEPEIMRLRLSLFASWLHSRDIRQVIQALGYQLPTAETHDMEEWVLGAEIKSAIHNKSTSGGRRYSDWLKRWVESLGDSERINVGCLNPSLVTGLWRWTPHAEKEDAMDVHRLASHHEGDSAERYDPIEAAVNNVLHQREGYLGIRKEPIQAWDEMMSFAERETQAEATAKSSVGRQVIRDAITLAASIEAIGGITPWGLAVGAGFRIATSLGDT